MSTRAERKLRRERHSCSGCGEFNVRHYVPASLGDEGFYLCTGLNRTHTLPDGSNSELTTPNRNKGEVSPT